MGYVGLSFKYMMDKSEGCIFSDCIHRPGEYNWEELRKDPNIKDKLIANPPHRDYEFYKVVDKKVSITAIRQLVKDSIRYLKFYLCRKEHNIKEAIQRIKLWEKLAVEYLKSHKDCEDYQSLWDAIFNLVEGVSFGTMRFPWDPIAKEIRYNEKSHEKMMLIELSVHVKKY